MAAASRSSKESATARNVRREDIDRRRKELLDRIKNVDESTLRELTLSVGKPQVAEDFHKYFSVRMGASRKFGPRPMKCK